MVRLVKKTSDNVFFFNGIHSIDVTFNNQFFSLPFYPHIDLINCQRLLCILVRIQWVVESMKQLSVACSWSREKKKPEPRTAVTKYEMFGLLFAVCADNVCIGCFVCRHFISLFRRFWIGFQFEIMAAKLCSSSLNKMHVFTIWRLQWAIKWMIIQ